MAVVVESTAGDACIRVDQQCGDAIEEMIDDQVGGRNAATSRTAPSVGLLPDGLDLDDGLHGVRNAHVDSRGCARREKRSNRITGADAGPAGLGDGRQQSGHKQTVADVR
jgi:hypothetical protein